MSANLINTHHYDGKWVDYYQAVKAKLLPMTAATAMTTTTAVTTNHDNFHLAIQQITSKWPQLARVSRLLLTDRANNYDAANQVSVEELLPLVWSHCQGKADLELLFKEQYADIVNGPCAQGRTTRLFQLLVAICDN